MKNSLRSATEEVKENLFGVRGSTWALLAGIALSLTSARLLLTGRVPSLSDQGEMLYSVTSLTIGLGLLAAGSFASASLAGEKETLTRTATCQRGALLLSKVSGVMSAWLLIFLISIPYVLLVGSGTRSSWVALTYTFVLGTLCVAGFATLILGIVALTRCGRRVALATSLAVFVAMTAPTLLGAALHKNWFGTTYDAISPFAHATLSLESAIVDKESLFVQLPSIGALAAFAVIAGVFAACGVLLNSDRTRSGHEAST